MWIIMIAFSVAIANIAGNNTALVPDMTSVLGNKIYITTIGAYCIFGSIISGLTAWLGITSGCELVKIAKNLYGNVGKKAAAIAILSICVPASALTGGFYSGALLNMLTGIGQEIATPLCLIFFSLVATEQGNELLKISNYIGLMLMPIIIVIFFLQGVDLDIDSLQWVNIDWLMVLALIGYNAGGMRSALVVEIAAQLTKKGSKVMLLVVLAKLFEGICTMIMAHLVLLTGAVGPLSITVMVEKLAGISITTIFNIVLFCVFINTMAPAMLVNARQVANITGLSFGPTLIIANCIVYAVSQLKIAVLLQLLSYAGACMILFIIYTVYFLHKYRVNL